MTNRILVSSMAAAHYYVGDRIVFSDDTRRITRVVTAVNVSASRVSFATFYRPSRGYARHIRRMKSLKRKK